MGYYHQQENNKFINKLKGKYTMKYDNMCIYLAKFNVMIYACIGTAEWYWYHSGDPNYFR